MARRLSKARAAAKARRRWLASPAVRARRVRSRLAFSGLGAAAAGRLLRSDFASALAGASANPAATVARSGAVVGYMSNHSAVVRTARGLRVETSTVPLRVADGAGNQRPVDLSVRRRGASFAAAQPLTGVSIAHNSGGGVAVGGEGLRIVPLGTNVPGRALGARGVFYGGVGRDMDAEVVPKLSGAELLAVLRSRRSPEQIRYRVALPAGASLRADGDGAIVTRANRVLARVPAPTARDAQGSGVPVAMRVAGDELLLSVAHRTRDLAYPVLVDPEVSIKITESSEGWLANEFSVGEPPEDTELKEMKLYSATPPSGSSGLSITLPAAGFPIYFSLEPEHERYVRGGLSELYWLPPKTPQIESVEFQGISQSLVSVPEGHGDFGDGVGACHRGEDGSAAEPLPSSIKWVNPKGFTDCNERIAVALTGESSDTEGNQTTLGGTISVGAIVLTRPLTKGEEEQLAAEGYGGENPAAPNLPHCQAGYPVDCATGNQVETQTDLSVGGRGLGLHLTRTYNSALAAKQTEHGLFGFGWTDSYSDQMKIENRIEGIVSTSIATVYQDNGSATRFERQLKAWVPVGAQVQATLVDEAGGAHAYTLPNQTVLHFNGAGQMTSEVDRNGNTTTVSHDAAGRLESIADPAGRKIKLAYNASGEVESATDPMGHVAKYVYEEGKLTSVTEPGGASARWKFKYDFFHDMTEMVDGRGNKVKSSYLSSPGQVTSQTDPLSRFRKWSYTTTSAGTETTIGEPNGSTTVEKFNHAGQPTSVTHAAETAIAATSTNEYDSAGNLILATDPNGHATKYEYNAAGDRTSAKNPDGNQTKWTYNATHDVVASTDPKGETTTITRDSHGNAETISRAAPRGATQTTQYTYGSHGELEGVTDPLGRKSKYEYNGQGDRTGATDPAGDKRTWGYDEDSREISMVSPRGNVEGAKASNYTTKIERDSQGRPLNVADPLGHTRKYAYDANGNLESTTDPAGGKVTYTYDADNERTVVKEPNGTLTEIGYDSAGQPTSQTDGAKHITKFVRNLLEEVTETVDPLARKTIEEYDKAGNVTSTTDAAKRSTTYTYDPADLPTEVSYSDGKTPTVKREYDKDGDVVAMSDGTGTTSYEYDQLGRLTHTTNGHGEGVGYEYDLANEQTKLTYPNNKSVIRGYDSGGRLQTVTDWLGHQVKLSYDADSDPLTTTFPAEAGNQDKYSYNEADQMIEARMTKGSETLASLTYGRDNDGQLKTTLSKGLPGEEKTTYTYDLNNRLTKAGTIVYGYDAADNPTKLGASIYTYDSANQLKTGSGVKFTYNAVGQRTTNTPKGAVTAYVYDQAGNLISVERPAEGKVPAIKDSYAYDGEGLRASQTAAGTSHLAWEAAEGPPLLLSDETNSYIYGPSGLPIEQINSAQGKVLYLHHDQQASTRLLTNTTGKSEATVTYDAYGNIVGTTGSASTPLGYDAQYTDADTGLVYMRARTYDPVTGQFPSIDPIGAITGQPYTYVRDNPLNALDPSGLSGCGSIVIVSTLCNGLQDSGISDVAAGVLNFATFGGSTQLAGSVFGFDPQCADFGWGGKLGEGLAFGFGIFDGESEVELAGAGADALASTGRTVAADLKEQLALEQARSNPAAGKVLQITLSDPRWPADKGWVKMAQNINGVEIHYVLNRVTGAVEDFKFIGGAP